MAGRIWSLGVRLLLAGVVGGSMVVGVAAPAQAWPDRPVRIVVAFPPGSSTDIVARALGDRLTAGLGQPTLVENRPGAGGNIATGVVVAATDGHTFLMHSTAIAVNPTLYKNAGYSLADLRTVAIVALTPNVLFVNKEVPAANLQELLALARTRPMEYASSGTGTTPHLGAELLFSSLAGVKVLHVPFAPAQAASAVLGGQVPIGSTSLPPALPLIQAGSLKPIALAGAVRDPALPDLPTVAEQGFPGFSASTWFGLFAPKGTPDTAALAKLEAETAKAMSAPSFQERLSNLSFVDPKLAGAAAAAFVVKEAETWAEVVKVSGATSD